MLKNFNPIIQDKPILFNEDVYLINEAGKVLTGRHGGKNLKDIFSFVEESEFSFIRDNMFFAGLHPLLLVDSSKGPIFIDDSLFGSYRLFVAVIPHFSKSEILAMVKNRLRSIVLPSPKMKAELELEYQIVFDDSHTDFIDTLFATHRGVYYYQVRGRTNGEISMKMSEIAYDFSRFCGCELELNIEGVGLFEMKNDLCVDSYIFALVSLLFAARNYSSSRKARMDIFFDEMGVYFEFGFELASEFRLMPILRDAKEMKNFKFWASSRLFDCEYYQNERAFAVRGYPWFKHPNSADLKERKREFIYNI